MAWGELREALESREAEGDGGDRGMLAVKADRGRCTNLACKTQDLDLKFGERATGGGGGVTSRRWYIGKKSHKVNKDRSPKANDN